MNIFTANQVNQVYVANHFKADTKLSKADQLGTITVGKNSVENAIYFQHVGAGGLTRSDLIDVKKVLYGKATPASKMERNLKVATVTLKPSLLEAGSTLLASDDYILRIKFDHVLSPSPESQYWKYGVVHGVEGMAVSDFYKTLALSVAKNMSREAVQLVQVFLKTNAGEVEVLPTTMESSLNGTYSGVVIKEAKQDNWILGIHQEKPVMFTIEPSSVKLDGEEVAWCEVAYTKGEIVGNGKQMADYEYFYMGERGDQYRMVGWPNYVPTHYLVDPTKTYDTITLHFAYSGANHAVQLSEKDVTILVPTDANITNSIIAAINKQAGTTVVPPIQGTEVPSAEE